MTTRFRQLLTATTALTFGLILLGVYTGGWTPSSSRPRTLSGVSPTP